MCSAQLDMGGFAVQECRAKAAEEMTQARRRLEASAADEDTLRQRAEQQAADIASQNNAIKDLQSEICRTSLNAKVRLLRLQLCDDQPCQICKEPVECMRNAIASFVCIS